MFSQDYDTKQESADNQPAHLHHLAADFSGRCRQFKGSGGSKSKQGPLNIREQSLNERRSFIVNRARPPELVGYRGNSDFRSL